MKTNSAQFWHDAILVVTQLVYSLLVFFILTTLIVFLLRKPLRQYKPIDLKVFDRMNTITSNRMSGFMQVITFLGNHLFLIPANLLLLIYYLIIPEHGWFSVRVAAVSLSSLVLMLVLKSLFRRKRPLNPLLKAARGLSFPSGHAIMSITFYGLVIYILSQSMEKGPLLFSLISFFSLLILMIGLSRVYLRVHYASDVLAGFIVGLLWLLISLSTIASVESLVEWVWL